MERIEIKRQLAACEKCGKQCVGASDTTGPYSGVRTYNDYRSEVVATQLGRFQKNVV